MTQLLTLTTTQKFPSLVEVAAVDRVEGGGRGDENGGGVVDVGGRAHQGLGERLRGRRGLGLSVTIGASLKL